MISKVKRAPMVDASMRTVAGMLDVCILTVYRMVKSGVLPHYRVVGEGAGKGTIRIPLEAVEKYRRDRMTTGWKPYPMRRKKA